MSIASVALLAGLASQREIHPDEMQHLHVARNIASGMLPYRDFFDHHGPVYAYLLAPVLRACADGRTAVFAGRALSFALLLLGLYLLQRLARGPEPDAVAGSLTAWAAILVFVQADAAAQTVIEIRPDVLQVPILLAAVLILSRNRDRRAHLDSATAGALFGLALLVTPKTLLIAPAPLAHFLALMLLDADGRRRILLSMACFCAGAATPLLCALGWFWLQGAESQFIHDTLLYNLGYPFRRRPFIALLTRMATDPAPFLLGALGMGSLLRQASLRSLSRLQRLVLFFGLTCLAYPLLLPNPTRHSFLPTLAFLALLAGGPLARMIGQSATLLRFHTAALAVGLIFALVMRQLFISEQAAPLYAALLAAVLAAGVVSGSVLRAERLQRICLIALIVFPPLQLALGGLCSAALGGRRTNHHQMEAIALIAKHMRSEDRLLNGFTNLGFMHEHVGHRWFFHEEIIAILGPQRLAAYYRREIESSPPRLVLLGPHVRRVFDEDQRWAAFAGYRSLADLGWPECAGPWLTILLQDTVQRPAAEELCASDAWRELRTRDGLSVWMPVEVHPEQRPVRVAIELPPEFRHPPNRARLHWSADNWRTSRTELAEIRRMPGRALLVGVFRLDPLPESGLLKLSFSFVNDAGERIVNGRGHPFRIRLVP
ncbi:MAG: glycosyltransferase family 39 protein [Deltaproteobacteria bacterium]|nr:glycosyltransferase family 39 protein [Deltaproteobacteria bacterium]